MTVRSVYSPGSLTGNEGVGSHLGIPWPVARIRPGFHAEIRGSGVVHVFLTDSLIAGCVFSGPGVRKGGSLRVGGRSRKLRPVLY